MVLVANNAYTVDLFSLGERERLDEGLLHVYSAEGLLPGKWEEWTGERFEIDAGAGWLRAAIDGEPERLDTPIELTIEPQALRVLVPKR